MKGFGEILDDLIVTDKMERRLIDRLNVKWNNIWIEIARIERNLRV